MKEPLCKTMGSLLDDQGFEKESNSYWPTERKLKRNYERMIGWVKDDLHVYTNEYGEYLAHVEEE